MTGDDYKIISDTTENGVRHITAIPSSLVCSQQIDFDIIDGQVRNLAYVRGCNGNLQAIGRLVEGMDIKKIVDTLSGVNCNFRGTSCTDQLARILSSL